MPLHEGDFASIRRLIENIVGKRGEYFVTGRVIKRDVDNRLVWLAEFGDQGIPIVAFDYDVFYYDEGSTGSTTRKKAKISPVVPQIGQTVLVARELGTRRIPRCLGVVLGKGWISGDES